MINRHIKVIVVLSLVVIILTQVFLGVAMPVINFLNNAEVDTEDDEDDANKIVIRHGESVFDESDPNYNPISKDDDDTSSEEEDEETYTPGVVVEATKISASQMKFEAGTKTILLLGVNSQEDLTDSIFLCNVNTEKKVIKLYSIPRDTYVPHSQTTVEAMKKTRYYYSVGSFKLNAVTYIGKEVIKYTGGKFNNSGIDYMCAVLNSMFGCEIDEYVKVDFEGFMDLIDLIGGVYVNSPENMYWEDGTLMVAEGYQKLDSKMALFYVRYRKRLNAQGENTGTGSDDYRKVNQANFLVELFEQIFTSERMTYGKMIESLDTLKGSVYHSFSASDVKDYLSIGVDYTNGLYSVVPYVVSGNEIDPFGDNCYYISLSGENID